MSGRLDRVLELVRREVAGHRFVLKDERAWTRLVGRVHPDFRAFTVVVGRTVYLPRPVHAFEPDRLAAVLLHELVHQLDQRRWGPLFYASYFLAAPAVRTVRAVWERRAYAVDLLLARERGGERAVRQLAERLAPLFSGRAYGWMWAGDARAFLEPVVDEVLSGRLELREPYGSILAAWRGPCDVSGTP